MNIEFGWPFCTNILSAARVAFIISEKWGDDLAKIAYFQARKLSLVCHLYENFRAWLETVVLKLS